ncbi:MAG: hypothetical protein LBN74_06335 [Prevotella sp.]|jgi:hypothetical protein|nr:hypothetical protein [Prevotella sp.]
MERKLCTTKIGETIEYYGISYVVIPSGVVKGTCRGCFLADHSALCYRFHVDNKNFFCCAAFREDNIDIILLNI